MLCGIPLLGAIASLWWPSPALAQSTSTITIFTPEWWYDDDIYASVVAADSATTVYAIECAQGSWTPDVYCGDYSSVTVTAGPSTFNVWEGYVGVFTRSFDCQKLGPSMATSRARDYACGVHNVNCLGDYVRAAGYYASCVWIISLDSAVHDFVRHRHFITDRRFFLSRYIILGVKRFGQFEPGH
ncbi:hypothetical protein NKR23_g6207 [Pleurostoma richardsiae]|uniref:Uncharacterized protein n=1 Tax=Pleurostoma richardsiae TaxID=41990 RepID=A0AA38RBM7_9PEZI|nr:hypothetical protein NKR23_g6207 [Pleurostoma richardsiae]